MEKLGRLWGDTDDTRKFAKKNLEEHLERLLREREKININDLYKKFWHPHHLLSHFLQIYLIVKELEEEGKVIVDDKNDIYLAKISCLNEVEIKEVYVCDIYHEREEVRKKKEITLHYRYYLQVSNSP